VNCRCLALTTVSAGLLAATIVDSISAVGDETAPASRAATTAESSSTPESTAEAAEGTPPLDFQGDERDWKFIVLHHSASDAGSVESIDAAHRARHDSQGHPWRGIGYHFVIGNGHGMSDGEIRPTFRWTEQAAGAHAGVREFNELGIGICLIGNFENAPPTAAQIAATRSLVAALSTRYGIAEREILTHGDLKATACPGRFFSREIVIATSIAEQE
jgi:N-acetyl-anhydromuramyl-L-alanine amidase AmpD